MLIGCLNTRSPPEIGRLVHKVNHRLLGSLPTKQGLSSIFISNGLTLFKYLLHTALTATAGSEKLSTQTEHIPALYRCWESVPTQKSNTKIGPFPKSSFLLVFWAWLRAWSQWSPGPKYKPKWRFRKRPDFCIWFLRGIYLSCPK